MRQIYQLLALILIFSTASACEMKSDMGNRQIIKKHSSLDIYNSSKQLSLFIYEKGLWESAQIDGVWTLTGKTGNSETIILSKAALDNNHKSLTFEVKADGGNFGIVFGPYKVVIKPLNNVAILYDNNLESSVQKIELNISKKKWHLVTLSTGYNPTDSSRYSTGISIDGTGFLVDEIPDDKRFGVWLEPHVKISIRNFDWFKWGK